MNAKKIEKIEPAKGKLAILTPGMGAVATTLYLGVEAVRKGVSKPIGSYTQMAQIRLGKRSENRSKKIYELVPLASLDQVVFGGWDIYNTNAYEQAMVAKVLDSHFIEQFKDYLNSIRPMPAVFDKEYVKRLDGPNVKKFKNKMEAAEMLRADMRNFIKDNGCDRAVMVWCASTEVYNPAGEVHSTLKKFEKGLVDNDPTISPSQIYTYAALRERIPYVNGSPNVSVEVGALQELAHEMQTPLAIIRNKVDTLLASKGLSEEQITLIASVDVSIDRLNRLNRGLLLLSKIENGQFIRFRDINLSDVIGEVLSELLELFGMRSISYEYNPNQCLIVSMDPDLAGIMVNNLLTNALKYTPAGGKVIITIRDEEFRVSNSGIAPLTGGEKVFNRFYRENQSGNSTGLG
ncbi:MAG: inositol-3-phosphate synthase, partial [Pseudomonadota bacterium]